MDFKKFLKYSLILLIASKAGAQNTFSLELEKDSLYRFNTSLRILDSLLQRSVSPHSDTAFYNSFGKAEVINLEQLLYFALNNNPKLKAMQYKIDAEKMRAEEISYLPDPMFESEADMISSNFKRVGEINFYASQSFPFPDKLSLSKKSALINSEVLTNEHHQMELDMINMIKTAYYDLFQVTQKIEINYENQQIVNTMVSASEARYIVGKTMQQELFKTQIELSKLMTEEFVLRKEKKNLLSDLSNLTKVDLDENTKISFADVDYRYLFLNESFSFENYDAARLIEYAFHSRPDLQALREKILFEQNELELSETYRYPDFSLKLGYKILPFESNNAFNIMAGISLPFAPWTSGKYDYRIQKNKISIKSAEEEYRNKQLEIRNEIQSTLNDLNALKKTLNYTYNILQPQAENALKSSQYSYETNSAAMTDVLDSYRSFQDIKLMFYETINTYLKTAARLERITGMNLKRMENMKH